MIKAVFQKITIQFYKSDNFNIFLKESSGSYHGGQIQFFIGVYHLFIIVIGIRLTHRTRIQLSTSYKFYY